MMELTKEQFRAQFKYGPIDFSNVPAPIYSETYYGYKIYRALQLLVLEDDGKFYLSRLS